MSGTDSPVDRLRSLLREATSRLLADPELLARVQAVNAGSPLSERLGAMLLGVYLPLTGDEATELDEVLARAVADMDKTPILLIPSAADSALAALEAGAGGSGGTEEAEK